MQFLAIRSNKRERADKRPHARAFVITKDRKFGEVIEEQHISIRRNILIAGQHGSGKTRWIERLRDNAGRIWASRTAKPLFLQAVMSVSDWTTGKHLETWWPDYCTRTGGDDRHWKKLSAGERQRALPLYLSDTGAVLFIDDSHKLTGKKLDIAKRCVMDAKVWVITAADEVRIAPSLRHEVLKAGPQIFRLSTQVAYDSTKMLVWLGILVAGFVGSPELAAILAGLNMLATGRKATRQQ